MNKKIFVINTFMVFCFTFQPKAHAQDTKYSCAIGGTYSDHIYGGNLKFDYLLSKKICFGIKNILSGFSFSDYTSPDAGLTETFRPGLMLMSDITCTWNILLNNDIRRKHFYSELGVGYLLQKVNYNVNYTFLSPFTVNERFSGLGSHFAFGYSCKLGNGNVFFEGMLGAILFGKFNHHEVYPPNYQLDANGVGHPNTGGNYKKSGSKVGYDFLSLNLGYTFYFH